MSPQLIGVILCGSARFSALRNGLVRLEWSAMQQFEDAVSVITATRPQPKPFKAISWIQGILHLYTEVVEIIYHPNNQPFNDTNLQINWHCGKLSGTWTPSSIDTKNLGGTFASLDLIHRNFQPQGVHPASVNTHYPQTEQWLYTSLRAAHKHLRSQGETTYFEEPPLWYLAAERLEELPTSVQNILEQWQHFPPGILSRSGYSVLNDSTSALIKEGQLAEGRDRLDWYFFAYGLNYAQALQDFVQLCGPIPMLPRWAFGVWFSVYEQMTDADYCQLVKHFDELNLPLDILVLDVDWHSGGWCGWDWNQKLFPKPQAFLAWAHSQGLHIGANVHLEGVSSHASQFEALCKARGLDANAVKAGSIFAIKNPIAEWIFGSWQPDYQTAPTTTPEDGWLLFNLAETAEANLFMEVLHSPRQDEGIDFWWIDGANATYEGVNSQLWTNHVYYKHQEATSKRRPLILSRTGGLGSHRYPVQFSADTYSHWSVLQFLVDFTSRAGNVGVSYWSHDIGGFFGPVPGVPFVDPELLVRWLQFGCFSPIVRLHSDHGRREPWHYGSLVLDAIRKALHLRMQLIPYLYHLTRISYDTGLPLCRPLYLAYPEDEQAYELGTFLLGAILVAPVVEPGGERLVYLPTGGWWERSTGQFYPNAVHLRLFAALNQMLLFVQAGAIIALADVSSRVEIVPKTLTLEVYGGAEGELDLYEDDGESLCYQTQGGCCRCFRQTIRDNCSVLSCEAVRGSYQGMPEQRNFQIVWQGLVAGSHVEATGVEIETQIWRNQVLCLTLGAVAQSACWQIVVTSS